MSRHAPAEVVTTELAALGRLAALLQVRPGTWIVDLFCGAGGATRGYQKAGFKVLGIDHKPQPNYCGDHFIHADAIEIAPYLLSSRFVSAVHASPPCQPDSAMSNCRPGLADRYARLIGPTREVVMMSGLPYVIENVVGADLRDPITLCGQMFGLELYRHRLFESNLPLVVPEHPAHVIPASKAGHWKPGTVMSVAGHVSPIAKAREVMEIDWMTRDELAEAIPPPYTEWIGTQLLAHIEAGSAA